MDPVSDNADRPEKPTRALPPTPAPDDYDSPTEITRVSGSGTEATSPRATQRNTSLRLRAASTTPGLVVTQETPEPPESIVGAIIEEGFAGVIAATASTASQLGPASPIILSSNFHRNHSPSASLHEILREDNPAHADRYPSPKRARTINGRSITAPETRDAGYATSPTSADGSMPIRPFPAQVSGSVRPGPRVDSAPFAFNVQMPVAHLGTGVGNGDASNRALRSQRLINNIGFDWNIPHTPGEHHPVHNVQGNGGVNGNALAGPGGTGQRGSMSTSLGDVSAIRRLQHCRQQSDVDPPASRERCQASIDAHTGTRQRRTKKMCNQRYRFDR